MTDRIRLDDLTSDALDALYEQLEAAGATETQRQLAVAREAFASATSRAARAEAALARVRDLRDDLREITGARWIADMLDTILNQPAPAAATQATEPDARQVTDFLADLAGVTPTHRVPPALRGPNWPGAA